MAFGDTYPRAQPKPAAKPSRLSACFDYLHTHKASLSWPPVQIVRDEPRRRRDDDLSWQRRVPKWVYLTGWVVMACVIGFVVSKWQTATDKDSQRIEAALLDAPSKYQARLSERVAVVEEQQVQLRRSVDGLTAEVKATNGVISDLNTQLKLFTAELRELRKER